MYFFNILFVVFGDVLCLDSTYIYSFFCWFGSLCVEPEEWQRFKSKSFLRGGFKLFSYVQPYWGKWSNFTNFFSDGLKPPTSFVDVIEHVL